MGYLVGDQGEFLVFNGEKFLYLDVNVNKFGHGGNGIDIIDIYFPCLEIQMFFIVLLS
jgi:hypothetical protein